MNKRKSEKSDNVRRGSFDDGDIPELHPGSYASEQQRKLFGVELPTPPTEEEERVKRKVAFLLAYLGTNYGGFQINEGQKTLQAEFELALFRTGMLLSSNFGYPFKYRWSTSGRTDKGVHACAQVCSAKIELRPDQTLDQAREELNAILPTDIRVLDILRTTRNFCAHTQRDRVRYQYMIPSFVFADVELVHKLFENVGYPENGRPIHDPLLPEEIQSFQSQMKHYRATPSNLETLSNALKRYEGTHNFHNFTKGVKPEEARATRFIVSFVVEEPIVFDNGSEWIPTSVVGQSFLLHQIRKMVAMAIDVTRGAAPLETIDKALTRGEDFRLNTAPAQGLFLEMSFYNGYNRRKLQNAELDDLDWDRKSLPVYQRWKNFRNGMIMNRIVEEEEKEGNFVKHIFEQEFVFDYKLYYNLNNSIDESECKSLQNE